MLRRSRLQRMVMMMLVEQMVVVIIERVVTHRGAVRRGGRRVRKVFVRRRRRERRDVVGGTVVVLVVLRRRMVTTDPTSTPGKRMRRQVNRHVRWRGRRRRWGNEAAVACHGSISYPVQSSSHRRCRDKAALQVRGRREHIVVTHQIRRGGKTAFQAPATVLLLLPSRCDGGV